VIGNEEEYTPERKNGIFRYITPNLDAHNKSLEWIESERKRIGAEIDCMIDDGYDSSRKCHIFINGRESGINYRLTLSFESRIANLLSKRIQKVELSHRNLKSILFTFQKLIHFETHWYDHSEGRWQHICLDVKTSVNHLFWPGDHIVSVMNCLSEDMTSVLDRNMRTLRTAMIKGIIISWFQGNNSEGIDFNKISQYSEWLIELDKTDSEFSFANKRDLILKNISNDWSYWEESQKTTQMKLYENVFSNLEDFQ
jgi:hypothetical protein|tara:strand:+ start:5078 stop:5842 length:765 start_codon:yes stop_codon:yes gene_type:complete